MFWRGKPVEEMTKEELIVALTWCCDQLADLGSPENTRARALGKVEMLTLVSL